MDYKNVFIEHASLPAHKLEDGSNWHRDNPASVMSPLRSSRNGDCYLYRIKPYWIKKWANEYGYDSKLGFVASNSNRKAA